LSHNSSQNSSISSAADQYEYDNQSFKSDYYESNVINSKMRNRSRSKEKTKIIPKTEKNKKKLLDVYSMEIKLKNAQIISHINTNEHMLVVVKNLEKKIQDYKLKLKNSKDETKKILENAQFNSENYIKEIGNLKSLNQEIDEKSKKMEEELFELGQKNKQLEEEILQFRKADDLCKDKEAIYNKKKNK
jgi:hypothetical protein